MVLKKRTKSVAKAKKKAASATRRPTSSLPETSAKTRASLFKGIHQVLDAHGIAGQVAELHLDATAPANVAAPCPPNTIRRVVCVRQDDGTMHCEERCVPV